MTGRMTRAGHRAGCMLALALTVAPATSEAQQPAWQQPQREAPERPTGAVFEGSRRPRRDVLNLTTDMYGGYDQELQGPPGTNPFGLVRTGSFAGLDLGLGFSPTQNDTVDFNARAFTSLRYYTNPSDLAPASSNGDAAASFRFGRRVSLQTRGGFLYAPYYDFPLIAVIPSTSELAEIPLRVRDVPVSSRRIGTYDAVSHLSVSLSRNTGLGFGYGVRRTDLIEESQSAVDTQASAQFNYRINRRTSTRVSYVHRESEQEVAFGTLSPVRIDDLETTIEREWVRSPTRQTHFSFTFGPSLVQERGRRLTRAIAGASLGHTFARSWEIRGSYRRGMTFLDGVLTPVPSNAVMLNLGGMLTRRLELSVGAAAILGEVGLDTVAASTHDSHIRSVRLWFAMSSRLALNGEYVYQQHRFNDLSTEPLPSHRSGVRGGLTWYLPLIQESIRREPPGARRTPATP